LSEYDHVPTLPAHGLSCAPLRQVLYQSEPLVDALVATGAHNYVDFKAVDGWYGGFSVGWHCGGRCTAGVVIADIVPASLP
jgi:hypothetical protein